MYLWLIAFSCIYMYISINPSIFRMRTTDCFKNQRPDVHAPTCHTRIYTLAMQEPHYISRATNYLQLPCKDITTYIYSYNILPCTYTLLLCKNSNYYYMHCLNCSNAIHVFYALHYFTIISDTHTSLCYHCALYNLSKCIFIVSACKISV